MHKCNMSNILFMDNRQTFKMYIIIPPPSSTQHTNRMQKIREKLQGNFINYRLAEKLPTIILIVPVYPSTIAIPSLYTHKPFPLQSFQRQNLYSVAHEPGHLHEQPQMICVQSKSAQDKNHVPSLKPEKHY